MFFKRWRQKHHEHILAKREAYGQRLRDEPDRPPGFRWAWWGVRPARLPELGEKEWERTLEEENPEQAREWGLSGHDEAGDEKSSS